MKVIKTAQFESSNRERRFRGSIYVDLWVPMTEDKEKDRLKATEILEGYKNDIPNSYIGGVGHFDGLQLDKEI